MGLTKALVFLIPLIIAESIAQENAQTRVPKSLLNCYQDPILNQRDNKLPSTMEILIDLIRKVENSPDGGNMDIRTMSISLLHRFRLDGIKRATNIAASSSVVPYSPTSFQFHKHKIILSNLLPGNAFQFPNKSLTDIEICSLHTMMSSTIELQVRGDEGQVCNKLSQYRTKRLQRDIKQVSDVEIMDSKFLNNINRKGHMKRESETEEDVLVNVLPEVFTKSGDNPTSQCPVESGVVRTIWGTVAVGPLLAGIAAGLQPQKVSSREFSRASNNDSVAQVTIDNKFAVTLAGDLAEIALIQGPQTELLKIGAAGGWNSTTNPKWYFLSQSSDHEVTDAEIRGGLDGLILATNMQSFRNRASSMKLSQLLDMYYSQQGVFSKQIRACNRKALFNDVAPRETLLNQVFGFAYILDGPMDLPGTIMDSGFKTYSTKAVEQLYDYIPSSLNDLSCDASATSDLNNHIQMATDIYIVLDASLSYKDVISPLTHLISNINIGPLGSNVTLLSGKEGLIICNSTNQQSSFLQCYNQSVHQLIPSSLEIPKILVNVKDIQKASMEHARRTNWAGGKSSLILVIAGLSPVSDTDIKYSLDQLKFIYEEMPDLKFLYMTTGSKDRFQALVKDSAKDVFTFTVGEGDNSITEINGVIKRIKEVHQRLINPQCGTDFNSTEFTNSAHTGYVNPGKVSYYRLHPNYFFRTQPNTAVKVQGLGSGTLTVCTSRTNEFPRANSSQTEGNCSAVTSNTFEINLKDACIEHEFIYKCPPLYISVEAGVSEDTSAQMRCTEKECPLPNSVKYTMSLQQLGCFSGAGQIIFSVSLLIISIIMAFKNLI